MTPQEFFNYTYGHAYDIDGSYGYQCWDGMAKFCKDVKIPLSVIHCSKTGYVQDIWELRYKSGILNYFDEIKPKDFKNGDWIIWGRNYNMTPKSHVAMYYNGRAYGQSQNGIKQFNLATLDMLKALGGFRWKEWENNMIRLKNGFQNFQYSGANLKIYKGSGDCKNLYMLSALGDEKATQDIRNYDNKDMIIMSLANCNYFEMNNKSEYGQHYGVEQSIGDDIHTSGHDLAPKNSAYEVFYELKNGECGRCTANDYWYSKADVNFACSPYATVVFNHVACNHRSSAFGNKDNYANAQTMFMKIKDAWCIVCTASKVLPKLMQNFALDCNADYAFLVDSGGSTQMMAYTGGKWESIIYTGRHIPNVLAIGKMKESTPTEPSKPTEPTEETVPKAEYDKLEEELRGVREEYNEVKAELDKANKKLDDIKKIIEE